MKYNNKVINDYINGNDIEDYTVEELENDKEFMGLVINKTNDEQLYNLCSDNLKKDYEFVKYIILKFKHNINFICEVADYYLEDVEDEFSRTELVIIMNKLTEKDKEKNMAYRVVSDAIYTSKRVEIELTKLKLEDRDFADTIGMGFLLIFDLYNSSKEIIEFYAKKIIDDIFNEYDIDLENMLHEQFKNHEQIDKMGINNYMLNFIGYYDSMLSSYLSSNIELMSHLKKRIKIVQSNWDKYNNINECKKYSLIIDKVHEYMEQIEFDCMFDETSILYHISKKLGIADKVAKYDYISEEMYNIIMNDLDDDFFEATFKVSPKDKFYYETVKRIISTIAFSNKIDEENIQVNENTKCKVLKLDFNKK